MANEPLYMRIKDDIKTDIKNGKYKKGDKIPTEPELSSAYDVSRITVRRAIEELSSEGYLMLAHRCCIVASWETIFWRAFHKLVCITA